MGILFQSGPANFNFSDEGTSRIESIKGAGRWCTVCLLSFQISIMISLVEQPSMLNEVLTTERVRADDLGDCSVVMAGLVFDRVALCTVDNKRGFAF